MVVGFLMLVVVGYIILVVVGYIMLVVVGYIMDYTRTLLGAAGSSDKLQ